MSEGMVEEDMELLDPESLRFLTGEIERDREREEGRETEEERGRDSEGVERGV